MSEQEKAGDASPPRASRHLDAPVGLRDVINFLKAHRDCAELELYQFYGGDYIPEANPFRQRDRLERNALMFREAVKLLEKQPNPTGQPRTASVRSVAPGCCVSESDRKE